VKSHSTDYFNTFIQVSDDCSATTGEIPPSKNYDKSIALIQYEIISQNPYKFTSDDVIFTVHSIKKGLTDNDLTEAKTQFFSKGQPCLRSSPLTKRYGWGIHSNQEGKIALYGVETDQYEQISIDQTIKIVKALRNSKI
jgi:hypothetical protein